MINWNYNNGDDDNNIKAKTVKINRYQQGVSQFQQNRFFRNNEGRFDEQIDESEEGGEMEIPDTQK